MKKFFNFKPKFFIPILIIILNSLCYAQNDVAAKVKWGYKGNVGPERWSQLNPDFTLCAKGRSQSPINLVKKMSVGEDSLTIHYVTAPLKIVNDGLTHLLIGSEQTMINDGHSVQANFSPGSNGSINLGGKTYRLVQFHIHTPSEHQWHGRSFPLEIHFVHQSDDGQLAIIGVFAQGGEENSELQKLIEHLPNEKNKEVNVDGVNIDPTQLLPIVRDYYTYEGSLTVPPCLEGVVWIVMSNPITTSPSQIVQLKKAMEGPNARPVQKLHKREIFSVTVPAKAATRRQTRTQQGRMS